MWKTKLWSIIQEANVQWTEGPERADKMRGENKERNNKDFSTEKHDCLDCRKKEGKIPQCQKYWMENDWYSFTEQ